MDIRNKRSIGSIGEKIAADYLKNCGFIIVKQNFRVGKLGEIDIVAQENEYICFMEVKSRNSLLYGSPAEAVNKKKQEQIKKIAGIYINQNKLYDKCIRFDVVEVMLCKKSLNVREINIIRNAF